MFETDLVAVCTTAFSAVFVLLAILAGVMQLITVAFPQKEGVMPKAALAPVSTGTGLATDRLDASHIAAIATTYQKIFPGKRVTHVEEIHV